MPSSITTAAVELSTFPIIVSFRDRIDGAVVPTSLTWTLTDPDGVIINSRNDVVVSAPAASVTIVLSGDDLALPAGKARVERVLTVEGTYNSTYGTGLPIREQVTFPVLGLVAVSSAIPGGGTPDPVTIYLNEEETIELVETHRTDTTSVHGIADTSALVVTTDARLSDARVPLAHNHTINDVTNLQTSLDSKAASSALSALELLLPRNYIPRVLSKAPAGLIQLLEHKDTSGTVAADSSPSGRNGTYPASGITYGQPGIGNGRPGVKLSGDNTYVQVGNASFGAAWNGNAFAAIAWGKVDDLTRWADLTSFRYLWHIRSTADPTYYSVMGKTNVANQLTYRRRTGGPITEVLLTVPPLVDYFSMGIKFELTPTPSLKCFFMGDLIGSSTSANLTTWALGVNPPIGGESVLFAGSLTQQEWFGWGGPVATWAGTLPSDSDMADIGRV